MITKKNILGYFLLSNLIPIAALVSNIITPNDNPWWAIYIAGWVINILLLAFWGFIELCVYLIRDEND